MLIGFLEMPELMIREGTCQGSMENGPCYILTKALLFSLMKSREPVDEEADSRDSFEYFLEIKFFTLD